MNSLSQLPSLLSNAPVTIIMMILTGGVSLLALRKTSLFFKLILHPYDVVRQKEYYRLLSFDLVHNDVVHLGLNLFMMWISCLPLEQFLRRGFSAGSLEFLLIYLTAHFCGAIYVTFRYRKDFEYSCAGASGSILGCLFSYMLLQPHIIAFYLPGIGGVQNSFTVLIYLVLLIRLQLKRQAAYSNELHFFGALGGALMTLVLFPDIVKF